MVRSDEKVIFVTATPHTAQSMPTLRFSLEDGGAIGAESPTDGIHQVGLLELQLSSILLSAVRQPAAESKKSDWFRSMEPVMGTS